MKFAVALSLLAALANAATQKCNPAPRYVDIVIDQSPSNRWTDEKNLRLEGAKQIIQSLTSKSQASDKLQADSVAVVGFGAVAWQVLDFSDPASASAPLERLKTDLRGGTAIGEGVKLALRNLRALSADQVSGHAAMVLFTDGENTWGSKEDLQAALNEAKAKGVRVSFVRLDSETGNRGLLSWGYLGGTEMIIDDAMTSTILSTGGTVSIVRNAANLQAFVDQVLKNGLTMDDGQCGGTTADKPGGVLKSDVTSVGLCSTNAQAVYTYTADKDEKLVLSVGLTSKNSPVELDVLYENKATGERREIKVNAANAAGTIEAFAKAGQDATLTVSPKGASSDACQYQVGLQAAAAGQGAQSTAPASAVASVVASVRTSLRPSSSSSASSSASALPSAPVCPSAVASAATVYQTVVSTVTPPAPSATSSACMCSCDTKGSKPFPKFEL